MAKYLKRADLLRRIAILERKERGAVNTLWKLRDTMRRMAHEYREATARANKSDEALQGFLLFLNTKTARDLWTGPQESPIDRKIYTTPESYAEHIAKHRLVVVKGGRNG